MEIRTRFVQQAMKSVSTYDINVDLEVHIIFNISYPTARGDNPHPPQRSIKSVFEFYREGFNRLNVIAPPPPRPPPPPHPPVPARQSRSVIKQPQRAKKETSLIPNRNAAKSISRHKTKVKWARQLLSADGEPPGLWVCIYIYVCICMYI